MRSNPYRAASIGAIPESEWRSVAGISDQADQLLQHIATTVPVLVVNRESDVLPVAVPPNDWVSAGRSYSGRIYLVREGLEYRAVVVRILWHELLQLGAWFRDARAVCVADAEAAA